MSSYKVLTLPNVHRKKVSENTHSQNPILVGGRRKILKFEENEQRTEDLGDDYQNPD